MRNYEIMFIVRPTLSEEDVKKISENFKNIITSNGSKISEMKSLGQKELAYEIKKCKSGYYFLIEVEATDDKAINEFDRLARINADIIRFLITKIEK